MRLLNLKPADYPAVLKCSGGYFAVQKQGDIGSGPWRTRNAAHFALKGDLANAKRAETTGDDL